jgi:hypothetical protein
MSDGIPVPLGGTTRAPQLDLPRAFTSALNDGLIPGLLKKATGGDRASGSSSSDGSMKQGGNPSTEPPPPADPVKDLFDLIGKQTQKKDKDKDKQDRKRDRDR